MPSIRSNPKREAISAITTSAVAITSLLWWRASALSALESIISPSTYAKRAISSFSSIVPAIRKITPTEAVAVWGLITLWTDFSRSSTPAIKSNTETISVAIDSIRPWPNGCSLSDGFFAILKPIIITTDVAESASVWTASAIRATLLIARPVTILTANNAILPTMLTQPSSEPYFALTFKSLTFSWSLMHFDTIQWVIFRIHFSAFMLVNSILTNGQHCANQHTYHSTNDRITC